ncbi:MAG: NAD(P)-binding domain-containing protein [Candidatus Desulfofervidus sp.]|nr:NAD(P)-binding domain-containing protein [Candidatus Desulfofervidus sp.]
MEKTKVAVVGAGPAGIATAVEAIEAGLNEIVILEKTDHLCDTMVRLYHEGKRVDPFFMKVKVKPIGKLSIDTMSREEFLDFMKEVVEKYRLDIRFRHEVNKIKKKNDYFEIQAGKDAIFEAPIVVVAIGIFGRPVKPSYKIPKAISNKVFFGIPNKPMQNKKILVVGGGNTAAEAACFLCEKNEVFLSYRRPKFFRLNPINLCAIEDRWKQGKIKLMLNTDIQSLEPEDNLVCVHFKDGQKMCFDVIDYCLGGSSPQAFLSSIGVEMEGKKPKVSEDGETNIKGLFLVGDLVVKKGTIMGAFNSAKRTVDGIIKKYRDVLFT